MSLGLTLNEHQINLDPSKLPEHLIYEFPDLSVGDLIVGREDAVNFLFPASRDCVLIDRTVTARRT